MLVAPQKEEAETSTGATWRRLKGDEEPTLQVVLAPDGGGWAAQAIEVDYAACGDSDTDARKRFCAGLEATARLNMERHGNLSRLLRPAAPETWSHLLARTGSPASMPRISREPVDMRKSGIQFRTIAYVIADAGGSQPQA